VLATGATHSYFGHDEFAHFAPGLKSLADAESLRNHILMAFENAEIEEDPERRKALMTFIMVGAGPTGVEMASAIAVMVRTTPAGKWLGCEVDRGGRVRIRQDLTVQDHPKIFVIGDTASFDQDGRPLPGVAQVAIQQGRYAAKSIFRQVIQKPQLPPFRYFDKGNLAVAGKNFAVLQSGRVMMSGFFAWLVWALIRVQFMAGSSLRFSVFLQWVWTYLSGKRGARLIIE
jgi:NADH dehydrogenase FAD-containing subunit